jgi:hypothetical protein
MPSVCFSLATHAMTDATFPGTPMPADKETIKGLFRKIMA